MGDELTGRAPGYHLAVDEGDAYDFLNTLSIVKAAGTATANGLAVVECRHPAGFSPPPHVHQNEDEAFYVLTGRLVAQLGEQQIAAEKGSFLWLPRGVQHGYVVGDEPCSMLIITTPAGFERFVAEVGTPTATTDRLPEPREPDVPRLMEIAGRYGMEFPPPPGHAP
jgi:quercetin dioxygenase-like cupin family protein